MSSTFLSFHLSEDFVGEYATRPVNWGFPIGGGNSLGEIVFITKYSRRKHVDGCESTSCSCPREEWHETCRRVIEGTFSILKDHCKQNRTPWNEAKAQRTAKDAYERLFTFKWTPPGRGLWMMGTEFVHEKRNSAALQNCAYISTDKLSTHSFAEATQPFVRLMEMSMLGVGVGFDTKGAGKLSIHEPKSTGLRYQIEDSREGWYKSVGRLLVSYFFPAQAFVEFDYSLIRPAGEPIRGFGGTAAGPGPLVDLHLQIRQLFVNRDGEPITSTDITDLMNLIGKCVVAGNVRRSAEIAIGDPDDEAFLDLKNVVANPERMGIEIGIDGKPVKDKKGNWVWSKNGGWGFTSNNSVFAEVGGSYDHLADRISANGEPGLFYLDLCRKYGRLIDPPNNRDYRAAGTNPCGEQTLESYECCTLVETFPIHHDSLDDYHATIKVAYLYGKAVTLLPTHWPETNEVMQRNRRIGCSVSGSAQFAEQFGWTELRTWLNTAYEEVQRRDRQYSEWLGVRESLKTTSVKPSGTVSLLAGVTPGVHWPTNTGEYLRRMRLAVGDPLLIVLEAAGYHIEPDVQEPGRTMVVTFPTVGPQVRSEREVSVWEKAHLAVLHQRYWADNQVSVTLTFTPEERDQVGPVLRALEGQLKSVSFLPLFEEGGAFAQMPYERVAADDFNGRFAAVSKIEFASVYAGNSLNAEGEAFCNNDVCLVPQQR